MKKNILLIPYSHQIGSTHTLLTIADYLKEQGHTVCFAGDGPYLVLTKDAGFRVEKLPEIPIEKYRECTDKGNLDYLEENDINAFIDAEIKLCKKLKIDLIIDTLRPTTYISSKLLKIPRITVNYAILTKYYGLPCSVPESHILNHTRVFPPLFNLIGKNIERVRKFYYKKYAKNYKKILKEKGLPYNVDYQDLVEGDPAFIYDIPEFAPLTKAAPKKFKYVGAIVYDMKFKKPEWLESMIALKEKTNLPVIYLAMGSTGSHYSKILDALVHYSKNINEIIIVGNYVKHKVTNKYEDDPNVFLTDFAPANHLLKISDVVVTHGGRGTIYHALRHAVPLIGIPQQLEQEWNNQRIEHLGLGRSVSQKYFTDKLLAEALDDILEHHSKYKDRCKKYSQLINNFNSKDIIINEVNKVLQKKL